MLPVVNRAWLPVGAGPPAQPQNGLPRPKLNVLPSAQRQGTAAKKEGRSLVCGTQESNRVASPTPAETEVRGRPVLPGRGGSEHQAVGAVPQQSTESHPRCNRLVHRAKEERTNPT